MGTVFMGIFDWASFLRKKQIVAHITNRFFLWRNSILIIAQMALSLLKTGHYENESDLFLFNHHPLILRDVQKF
jgi:hypothetical protein